MRGGEGASGGGAGRWINAGSATFRPVNSDPVQSYIEEDSVVFFDGDSVLCDVMKGIRRFAMWFREGTNMNLYSVSCLLNFENVGKETGVFSRGKQS